MTRRELAAETENKTRVLRHRNCSRRGRAEEVHSSFQHFGRRPPGRRMSLPSPADLPNDWASVDFGGNWARLGPWAQGCGASISAAAQRVTLRVALGTPLAIQRSQAALRRLSRVKQKDNPMHTSIPAVVARPL